MGTRASTLFIASNGSTICNLYRQYDGYPDGHGEELKNFLSQFTITNGIKETDTRSANGIGCLAAQTIAHFKISPGRFYMAPNGHREWFVYEVVIDSDNKINLGVYEGKELIYLGPVESFNKKDRIRSSVVNCARCGDDHTSLPFKRLKKPQDEWTYWSTCPTTDEPIMLAVL